MEEEKCAEVKEGYTTSLKCDKVKTPLLSRQSKLCAVAKGGVHLGEAAGEEVHPGHLLHQDPKAALRPRKLQHR